MTVINMKKPSEYDTVFLLTGSRSDHYEKIKDFLESYNHNVILIGNGKDGFTRDQIHNSLEENSNEGKTLLYINAHGNNDEGSYIIEANTDTILTGTTIFKIFNDYIGKNIDLITTSCHSGALFNDEYKKYFENIFTASDADVSAKSTDTSASTAYMEQSDLMFSFDNYAGAFYGNIITNTGAIAWKDNGFYFNANTPLVYYLTPKFDQYLENNCLQYPNQATTFANFDINTLRNDWYWHNDFLGKKLGSILRIEQKINKFFDIIDNPDLKKQYDSLKEIKEVTEFIDSINITNQDILINLKEDILDVIAGKSSALEMIFGEYCTNPKWTNDEDEGEDEDEDEDITLSNFLKQQDISTFVKLSTTVGFLQCDDTHYKKSYELEALPISYMYAEFLHQQDDDGIMRSCSAISLAQEYEAILSGTILMHHEIIESA